LAQDGSSHSTPIVVASILGVHGVAGQVRVRAQSDVPDRFDVGQVLYLGDTPYHIESSDPLPRNLILIKFREVGTPEEARLLQGLTLTINQPSPVPLTEGEYFHYQLMGLRVQTEDGEDLGTLTEILETGSNDVYIVTGPGGSILLPALSQVVLAVDLAQGLMVVHLLEGLR